MKNKKRDTHTPAEYSSISSKSDMELFLMEIKRLEDNSHRNEKIKNGFRYFEKLNELITIKENKKIETQKIKKENDEKALNTTKQKLSDDELFLREVEGIKKITGPEKLSERPAKKKIKVKLSDYFEKDLTILTTPEDYYNFLDDPFSLEHSSEFVEWVAPDIDKTLAKRLHKGEFSVQEYLDLHGYIVEDALKLCYEFLTNAIEKNKKCLAIIHGRGLSSDKGPIIKEAVIRWLKKGPFKNQILTFTSAPRTDGGLGVTYVLLRKNKFRKINTQ